METETNKEEKLFETKYAVDVRTVKYTGEGTFAQIIAMRDIENKRGKILKGTRGAYVLIDRERHLSQEDESWANEGCILGKNTYVSGDGTLVKDSKITGCAVQGNSLVQNSLIRSSVGKDNIRSAISGEGEISNSKVLGGRFNMKGNSYIKDGLVIIDRDCSISLDGREQLAGLEKCVVNVFRTSLRLGPNSEDVVLKPTKKGYCKVQPTNAELTIAGEEYNSSLIEGVGSTLAAEFVDEITAKQTKPKNGVRISPIYEKENKKGK